MYTMAPLWYGISPLIHPGPQEQKGEGTGNIGCDS